MLDTIKGFSKKQKIIIIAVIVVLGGFLSGFVYKGYADNQEQQKVQEKQNNKYKELSKLVGTLTDKDYLTKDLNQEKIDTVLEKVKTSKSELSTKNYKKLIGTIDTINLKLTKQNEVNALFKSVAINGSEVKEVTIQDNLTNETVDKVALDDLLDDDFKVSLEKLKSDAKKQIKAVADKKAQTEKENAEKAKKEAEEKAKAEQEQANAQAQADQNAQANSTSDNNYYQEYSNSGQYTGNTGQGQASGGGSGSGSGYVYHTPTQEELNQSEKAASEADYSHLQW